MKKLIKRQRSLNLNKSRKFPKPNQHKIRLGNGGQLMSPEKPLRLSINMDDFASLADQKM